MMFQGHVVVVHSSLCSKCSMWSNSSRKKNVEWLYKEQNIADGKIKKRQEAEDLKWMQNE